MTNVIPLQRSEARPAQLRAVLYGRASKDRHKRGRSIRDQFAVSEIECADRGWRIVDRYEDRDRSATRAAKKVREEFDRMITDAEEGKFDVIVYAESSRVSRNLDVSVTLRGLCSETGILLCYNGRVYDMRVPADFKEFSRDALQAEEEGEAIIARNRRTARLTARRGGVWGVLPFGYIRNYDPHTGELIEQTPHPEEAPVIRELFARAEAHESLRSLIPLVRPFRPDMTEPGVRTLLRNKTYIGLRAHHDDEYRAVWPAIVEESVFWRVQSILNDPERRTTHTSGHQHLLTGIALCADCRVQGEYKQARMTARLAQPKYQRGPLYRCRANHLSIMEPLLDAYMEEAILTWLGSEKARKVLQRKDTGGEVERERARCAAMARQLEEAREAATTFDEETGLPRLSALSLAALEQRVMPLLAQSEERVRGMMSAGDPLIDRLMDGGPDEVEKVWSEKLTMEQRRRVIRKLVRVEVRRALSKGRGQPVGPRVGLIFLGEPGFGEWPAVAG